ncbi:MAG: hydroxymethylbilane synthase [Anaerovoracaceae bacterium]
MKKRKVIVGSRDSKLAVLQTRLVMDEIAKNHPEIELELVTMKTTGDIILDRTLDKIGGKGLFVKELDKALMDKRVDITIHSLKDLPMEENKELPLLAFSKRANPYDVLVLPEGETEIDLGMPIGSSSARRNLQLEEIYGDFESKSVRGNVITRLSKLDSGEYGSLILAHAGLTRLGLGDRISKVFDHNDMIPSAGQGILVVQGRAGEDYSYLECIDDPKSRTEAMAERQFVRVLDGGCSSPIGAFAMADKDEIEIFGLYYNEETKSKIKGSIKGSVNDCIDLATELAVKLKGEGND